MTDPKLLNNGAHFIYYLLLDDLNNNYLLLNTYIYIWYFIETFDLY